MSQDYEEPMSVTAKIANISKGELISKIEDLEQQVVRAFLSADEKVMKERHRLENEAQAKVTVEMNKQIRAINNIDKDLNVERQRRYEAETALNTIKDLLSKRGLTFGRKVELALDRVNLWHKKLGEKLTEQKVAAEIVSE
jgi:hypothetical protein